MSALTYEKTPPPTTHYAWPDRLAFDIALKLEGSGDKIEEILAKYELDALQLQDISKDKLFQKRVSSYREDIKTNGVTFRMKARAQAEELLLTSWQLIHDPDVSPAVKADLIKSTVKWSGLEPKDNPGDAQQGGGGVKITINMGDASITAMHNPTPTIEHDEEIAHGE